MLAFIFLTISMDPTVSFKVAQTIPIPDVIYEVEDMVVTGDAFYLLDYRSKILTKLDRQGNLLAIRKDTGQGPGEFMFPLSLTVGNGKVFVADYHKVFVFSDNNLSYLYYFEVFDNIPSMEFFREKLYFATIKASEDHACFVFDTKGKPLSSFYNPNNLNDAQLPVPLMEQSLSGRLFFLHGSAYQVSIMNSQGNLVKELKTQPSPRYKDIISLKPFQKKYGPNLAAYNNWRSEFSESKGIAIEKERYLWLYFRELGKDLRTEHHYAEVYDLQEDRKIISWTRLPGGLFDGGDYAYVVEELTSGGLGDYRLQIKGLETVPQ